MIPTIFGKTFLQRAALALLAASLSGCFDDGSSGGGGPVGAIAEQPPASGNGGADDVPVGGEPLPTPANQPPEVSGTPAASATAGQAYSFRPEASDADGDFLEYSITNRPAWASFSDETGLLSGTPDDGNVGESEEITITVTDGRDTRSIGPFRIRVNGRTETPQPGNNAPTIAGAPAASVMVDAAYSFTPSASDPDGDRLRFSISNRPSWATFSTSTGRLSGTPRTANIATYSNIVISVNDGTVTRSLPAFAITVQGPNNRAPTISGSPATSVQATQTYTFQPTGSDPDRDPLVYRINNRPRWATFSTASGRLSGTPAAADVGTYANLIISVSDGRVSTALAAFTITVREPSNRAPTISGSAPTTATVGMGYSFTPNASDPDGNTLGFTIQNRPSWAAFDTATGRLSGTPPSVGTFSGITITASDGRLSAVLPAFSISVSAPSNSAPTIGGSPATTVTAGSAYNFQPSASDPNGDALTFSIQNAPSWATFNASTGRLSGTPSAANAGTYSNIVISVSDGARTVSLPSFAITVSQGTSGNATLSWTPPTQNTNGTALTNLAGYRVVYGRSSSNLDQTVQIANPGLATYTVTGLSSGTWYFAVKAYSTAGAESAVSNTGSKTIP
ncbi:MAG: putative Ig domain-containing protein [Pseudomonadota bacterium]|nr:putative Ig domain-containing protein [Pseudomonadota bacterium]